MWDRVWQSLSVTGGSVLYPRFKRSLEQYSRKLREYNSAPQVSTVFSSCISLPPPSCNSKLPPAAVKFTDSTSKPTFVGIP
ncbi:hypothetical protein Mp_1g00300 [Marchantia polymorpha subsp. ruderalis]|uniref:Uncharacterized protein n=2 Tax=Marchantia polymorpha TaxID=3197 RepID=A0AAF6AJW9_MARPO|nr:hypothetical protein MARPO_0103s0057 [Marchantia polymorpha]BBM96739.1 hypothetical protein Mp_1g00300 [Marchantia polymorpha subsp. ruderalis]|eukprot:PTQ32089.1 hypothetical protein MARPO_0103s0057 [Marchantia polymorpha]